MPDPFTSAICAIILGLGAIALMLTIELSAPPFVACVLLIPCAIVIVAGGLFVIGGIRDLGFVFKGGRRWW
jgi:hypothetical protein